MKCKLTSFAKRKAAGEQIVMCTAYDAPFAKLVSGAGIDVILVGDSVGTTLLGFESTVPVTMSDMLRHTAAVRRGAPEAFVVFDMPFMSYQASTAEALHNAAQALKECGADAVKLEGGAAYADLVKEMVRAGIPVMGHIGLMPQSVNLYGGYKVAGRGAEAEKVLADALALQEAGVFSIVLECVPEALAKEITEKLTVPTIGIGSGRYCSGQVQVLHDLLGLLDFKPKHAGVYLPGRELIGKALSSYAEDVRSGKFPGEENIFN